MDESINTYNFRNVRVTIFIINTLNIKLNDAFFRKNDIINTYK